MNKSREEERAKDPQFDKLQIYSQGATVPPSQCLSSKQRPIYISEASLGDGKFGSVDKVVDVSTGSRYARKKFHQQGNDQKEEKAWRDQIAREIRILREYPHVSMI